MSFLPPFWGPRTTTDSFMQVTRFVPQYAPPPRSFVSLFVFPLPVNNKSAKHFVPSIRHEKVKLVCTYEAWTT